MNCLKFNIIGVNPRKARKARKARKPRKVGKARNPRKVGKHIINLYHINWRIYLKINHLIKINIYIYIYI